MQGLPDAAPLPPQVRAQGALEQRARMDGSLPPSLPAHGPQCCAGLRTRAGPTDLTSVLTTLGPGFAPLGFFHLFPPQLDVSLTRMTGAGTPNPTPPLHATALIVAY